MKNKWLLYVVLFMLAINAALVGVNVVQNNKTVTEESRCDKSKRYKDRKFNKRNFEEHLAEKLEFTEEQQRQVELMRKDFKTQRNTYRQNMSAFKEQYVTELSQEIPDTLKLEKLVKEIAGVEALKLRLEYQHYRNIRSVCTPEQAAKLDSIGNIHMKNHFRGRKSGKH